MGNVFAILTSFLRGTEKGTTTEANATVTSAGSDTNALDVILRTSAGKEAGAAVSPLIVTSTSEKVDDAAFAPAVDKVLVIGAEADEAAADSVDEGDAGALRMTLPRALHVNLRNASGTELGASLAGSLKTWPTNNQFDDAAFVPGDTMIGVAGAIADEAAPDTVDEGDAGYLRMTLARGLHANLRDSSGNEITLQKADDVAFTPAVDKVIAIGAFADETSPDIVDEGDIGAVRMTLARGLHANLRDSLGYEVSKTDDTAFTPGASGVLMVGAEADETAPDAVDEGDAGALRMTLNRALHVNPRNSAGTEVSVTDNAAFTDGTTPVIPAGFIYDETLGTILTENDAAAARIDRKRAQVVTLEDGVVRGHKVGVSPIRDLRTSQPFRVAGTTFIGTNIDTNFWTATTDADVSSTVTQATSLMTLASGTANSGYANVVSVRPGRFIFAHPMLWRGAVRVTSAAVTLNTRRWGAFTTSGTPPAPQEGFYFEVSAAGVLSVVSCTGGTPNAVSSGSFNGEVSSYTLDTNVHAYEITYFVMGAWFSIDGVLIHTFTPTTAKLAAMDLNIQVTSVNGASGTTSGVVELWASTLMRLGRDVTLPRSATFTATTAGNTLKIGPGTVHALSVSSVGANSAITVYDNTAASGTTLWASGAMGATTQPFDVDLHNSPFYTGLTIVIATSNCNLTVLYE